MPELAYWWLALEALGLAFFPLGLRLFSKLPDRGYCFSKILGLLALTYLAWLLGLSRLLPFSRGGLLLLLLLLALASALVVARRRASLVSFFREKAGLLLAEEAVFTLALVGYALFRAKVPEIAGTEKPMDFAFLTTSMRSSFFPPLDPWLSGETVSYYYLGYLQAATLAKLSATFAPVAYNLGLSATFALAASAAFGLGANLVLSKEGPVSKGRRSAMPFVVGLLLVVFLLVAGNLQGSLELVRGRGWGSPTFWQWVGVNGALEPYESKAWYPDQYFWWWRSTRLINTLRLSLGPDGQVTAVDDSADYTITEFPFFSFLLGDLHPHVTAIPLILAVLGLSLSASRSEEEPGLGWFLRNPGRALGVSWALGALGFANAWDLPTFGLVYLASLSAGFVRWRARSPGRAADEASPGLEEAPRGFSRFFKLRVLFTAAAILALAFVLYLPFYLGFRSQAAGFLPVRGVSTRPVHYLIFWGPLLVPAASFAFFWLRGHWRGLSARWQVIAAAAVGFVPIALWLAAVVAVGSVLREPAGWQEAALNKGLGLVPFGGAVALAAYLFLRSAARASPESSLALLALFAGLSLTFLCELFFVLDLFGTRMNTVFKIYYQAWILLAVAAAYGVYYVLVRPSGAGLRSLSLGVVGLLLLGGLAYPVAAVASRWGESVAPPTLDGLDFVRRRDPAEYEAIQWLWREVEEQPVLLQASGPSYSEFAQVAARSGLPTILGWPGHEEQWRGSVRGLALRERDVERIYQSQNEAEVRALLERYDVSYVYVGPLERMRYPQADLGKFARFMDVAFRSGDVTIYVRRAVGSAGEGLP